MIENFELIKGNVPKREDLIFCHFILYCLCGLWVVCRHFAENSMKSNEVNKSFRHQKLKIWHTNDAIFVFAKRIACNDIKCYFVKFSYPLLYSANTLWMQETKRWKNHKMKMIFKPLMPYKRNWFSDSPFKCVVFVWQPTAISSIKMTLAQKNY